MLTSTRLTLTLVQFILTLNLLSTNSCVSAKVVSYSLKISYIDAAPDGILKKVLSFNGQFPGPTLRASKGDILSVSVTNNIQDFQTTTIHWHGLEQFLTPFQDGPRMITQCDIPYNYTHTYNIPLKQSGTYWYHAHHTGQASEGLWGALIIDNTPIEVHRYDGEFLLALSDWYHKPSEELAHWYQDLKTSKGGMPIPDAGLINGLGNYPCTAAREQGLSCFPNSTNLRYKLFEVEKGKTYRFRVLNSATIVLFAISIDNHKLEVIETDGVDTFRVKGVDRATVSTGARTSFLVKMNGDLDQYWIRIWTDLAPYKTNFTNINPRPDIYINDPYMYAVLRYKNFGAKDVPIYEEADNDTTTNWGAVQGRPDHHDGSQDWTIPSNPGMKGVEIQNIDGFGIYRDPMIVPESTAPFPTTNETISPIKLNHMDCLPFGLARAPIFVNQVIRLKIPSVDHPLNTFKPGFNNITFSTKDLDKPALVKVMYKEKLPSALNPIEIKGFGENYVVEMIIDDFGDTGHPLHLHGHTFWVMGYGLEGSGPFSEELDRIKLKTGVRRETMAVQPGSWLVIRFRADNPGVCYETFNGEAMRYSGTFTYNLKTTPRETLPIEML